MLIGIDGNEANIEKRVGVNMYAFELLCYIYKLQDEWKGRHKIIIYLKGEPRRDLPLANENWQYKVIPGRGLWILTRLMPHLYQASQRPDIFFAPSHYLPLFSPMPKVCSIMDLGYLKFSEQFKKYDYWQLRLWTAWSVLVAKQIFAISQSTRDDIVRHYPFSKGKVVVTQLGFDGKVFNTRADLKNVRRIKMKYSLQNYVLFLSTLKPSKNVEGLVEAWGKIVNKYPDFKLVLAGKKGWLYENIFHKIKDLGLENKIVFTDFVSEKDKPALIKGAKLFALPSFWEGFGIDVLSAMASGVPVMVSDKGSLPEVVGKAGVIVDPEDINSMALGIDKILSLSKNEYTKLVKKGLVQVKKFSWEGTARKTLATLTNGNL